MFWIEFSSSASTDDDLANESICIEGTIKCLDSHNNEIIAGNLRLFYLDMGAVCEANEDVFHLFDLRGETEPFYSELLDHETGWLKTNVEELLGGEIFGTNVLIIDRLEILPEFRGNKIGLACLNRCIQQYAHGFEVIALKCFPLQFEAESVSENGWRSKMEFAKFTKDRKKSFTKLRKYYSSIGFRSLPRSNIMVRYAG
jgi:GNAT superfamily N-acetyltransferase